MYGALWARELGLPVRRLKQECELDEEIVLGRADVVLRLEVRRKSADLSILRKARNKTRLQQRKMHEKAMSRGLTEAEEERNEELIWEERRLSHLVRVSEREITGLYRQIARIERGGE